MKTIKVFFAIVFFSLAFTSCTDDNDDPITIDENPLAEFNLLTTIDANGHSIEVYSDQDQYTIGYNELFYRIKDQGKDSYVSDAEIKLNPVMHMTSMMHSCPKSAITKTDDASVFKGYSVFQMPGNADEYWELNFEYTIGGQTYEAAEKIAVKAPADGKKRVATFTGADEKRYIVAMMPIAPEVKINDFSAMVFTMENRMLFPAVANYSISIDPRMPSMGNHSSPNNENLRYDTASGRYKGKLSLTMTGYWKINLKLMNEADEVLKGEDITTENKGSSLYFELEF